MIYSMQTPSTVVGILTLFFEPCLKEQGLPVCRQDCFLCYSVRFLLRLEFVVWGCDITKVLKHLDKRQSETVCSSSLVPLQRCVLPQQSSFSCKSPQNVRRGEVKMRLEYGLVINLNKRVILQFRWDRWKETTRAAGQKKKKKTVILCICILVMFLFWNHYSKYRSKRPSHITGQERGIKDGRKMPVESFKLCYMFRWSDRCVCEGVTVHVYHPII